MSIVGRKPIPAQLHKLKGSFRSDRHEVKPGVEVVNPSPPRGLPRAAKEEWRRMAAVLSKYRLLSDLDLTALEMYCRVFARWQAVEKKLQEVDELVFETENKYQVQSAYLGIANACMKQLNHLMGEFGMTPATRERLRALNDAPQKEDAFDEFMKKKAVGR